MIFLFWNIIVGNKIPGIRNIIVPEFFPPNMDIAEIFIIIKR